jgi:fumarate hydratase subunit beta
MDGFLEMTLQNGVAATIGKGTRDANVTRLAKEYKAPYLLAVGGAGAYLAQCVTSSKILAFEDLGAEAVRELIIKDFPVIVGIDKNGECAFF